MIIRAVVNQFDYLTEDERFLKYDIKKIYAPVGERGVFKTVDDIIAILQREKHIDVCLIDQTVVDEEQLLEWLWIIRKQIGEHVRIIPLITNENLLPILVQKQFNQFFFINQQIQKEIQIFNLFGLLMNPRTVADVEQWLSPMQITPKEEQQTRIISVPEIRQLPATKQQRIAFVGLLPQVGTTTICLELIELLEAQGKKVKFVSFDKKIVERSNRTVDLRQEEQFLEAELRLFQSEAEYIIYDCTAKQLTLLQEQAALFNQVYYILSYNYPLLLEHAQTLHKALKGNGIFILNQHQTIPKIDEHLRTLLMLQAEQQLETLPMIERDTIIAAEMQHIATKNQHFQDQLAKLVGVSKGENTKTKTRWLKKWHS